MILLHHVIQILDLPNGNILEAFSPACRYTAFLSTVMDRGICVWEERKALRKKRFAFRFRLV